MKKQINKIKRLAKKRGTPLLDYSIGKRHISFQYQVTSGIKGYSYSSIQKGIETEIKRLGI